MANNIKAVLNQARLEEKFDPQRGDCVEVALAMHDVFGGTIVAVGEPNKRYIFHAVLRYNGKLYDSNGETTEKELCVNFLDQYADPDDHVWEPQIDSLFIYKNDTYRAVVDELNTNMKK